MVLEAQANQIKDLKECLDKALEENRKCKKLFDPNTLATTLTNALTNAPVADYRSRPYLGAP